jgi:hypothetical protein
MAFSLGDESIDGVAAGRARRALAAAVFSEVGEQRVHRAVFGRIDQLPPEAALRDEAGMDKLRQVEGQGRGLQAKAFSDAAGSHAFWPGRHQQAEERKAGFLSQSTKGNYCASFVHRHPSTFRRILK